MLIINLCFHVIPSPFFDDIPLRTSSGFIRGPGEGAKPLAFAFHNKFKQGPLLSVVRYL